MTILVTYKNFPLRPDTSFVFEMDGWNPISFDTNSVLDTVFRQCNHVDGSEWIADKDGLRSMSVGDEIFLIDGNHVEKYLVAGCGFTRQQ